MRPAYVCIMCRDCEQPIVGRPERIRDRAYCRRCAKAIRAEVCPGCGHPMLGMHTPFGCLVEISETAFCPCPPPALAEGREGATS